MKRVPIEKLGVEFFIRTELDQERVIHLGELYEAGVKLPPLLVTPRGEDRYCVIDGRNRREALIMLGCREAECTVQTYPGKAHEFAAALRANMGGAQCVTREDIRRTIQTMLAQGIKQGEMVELLPLPRSIIRKFLVDATSNERRQRLTMAKRSVLDGKCNVPQAALEFKVDKQALRKELGEKKGRLRAPVLVGEAKSAMRLRFKSLSLKNSNALRTLVDAHEEGDVPTAQVINVFSAFETSVQAAASTIHNHHVRFLQRVGKNDWGHK